MKSPYPWIVGGLIAVATLAAAQPASAHRVVYTLRTVADGQIGGRAFTEAELVFTFTGDTNNIQTEQNSTGGNVYTNRYGTATVTVDDGVRKTVATFGDGQVYVRLDAQYGVVGFGSSISPTYPVALGCAPGGAASGANCANLLANLSANRFANSVFLDGTADSLADITAFPADLDDVSLMTQSLPNALSRSTLLTGSVIACAVPLSGTFSTVMCPSPAPSGLSTNRGAFYLQDSAAALAASYFDSIGYGFANVGAMRVEVL